MSTLVERPTADPEDTSLPPGLADRLRAEAARSGTPVFAYDGDRLDADAARIRDAFPDPRWLRLYSVKANGLPGIIARFASRGFGASAVSRGEVDLALRAGLPESRIALEGIGKTGADLLMAVRLASAGRPLLWVSLESADDAAALRRRAARSLPTGARMDVLVRVNPSVDPETHGGLAVGRSDSKFGIDPRELAEVVAVGGGTDGPLRWRGIHIHVGSQLRSVTAWRDAVEIALDLLAAEGGRHLAFDTLDVGGGFPADPSPAGLPTPSEFAAAAEEAISARGRGRAPTRLAIEPGRALVAAAGWLVARVLHVRIRGGVPAGAGDRAADLGVEGTPHASGRQVVLDAGMTELLRPALYGARHPILALTSLGRPVSPSAARVSAIVDGPICESTDRFGPALLPELRRGDLVAIGHAGAYGSAMASTYNGRPRPPEVLLEPDGHRKVLRRRQSIRSLP